MEKTYETEQGKITYKSFNAVEVMKYRAEFARLQQAYKEGGNAAILDPLAKIVEGVVQRNMITSVDLTLGGDKVTSFETLYYHDEGPDILAAFATYLVGGKGKEQEKNS